jgi:aspartyl/asparaginyl beta-hydroxylase (cupin superfamily)
MTDNHLDVIEKALAALKRGAAADAAALLQDGMRRFPKEAELPLNLSLARRMQGDLAGALAALDQALAIDPYFFMALLSKGVVLEQAGQSRAAAKTFKDAITIAPQAAQLPPPAQAALAHAHAVVKRNAEAMHAQLQSALAPLRDQHGGEALARMEECAAILAGVSKPYVHEALFMTVPQLPAIPFYPREYFPWFAQLEAASATIQTEAQQAMERAWGRFDAYIQRNPGEPVNQWAELNGNRAWSTLHLWRDGAKDEAACALMPQTAGLLDTLPLARQPGFGPTAMVSVLQPRTRIPAHTGSTNSRLICHLPLVIPPACGFRVGNFTREWRFGEAFVFDDSIEHEAWNDSDQVRTVFIFDVWNPLLTEAEREACTALATAVRAYNQGG